MHNQIHPDDNDIVGLYQKQTVLMLLLRRAPELTRLCFPKMTQADATVDERRLAARAKAFASFEPPGDYLRRVLAAHAENSELVYGVLYRDDNGQRYESFGLPRANQPSSGSSWTR